MNLRRTMKAQNPKKKEKERNNNNNNNNNNKRGSRSGQRICSKKKDPNQTRGYAARFMFIFPTKAIKKFSKTRYYLCNPWSKPVGSRVDSKGGMVWPVGE